MGGSFVSDKQDILKNTIRVGWLTGLSRMLAIFRSYLQMRFLGVGLLSDAFLIAFRIPSFLRKIFAEGALSAAFVPAFVDILDQKNGKTRAERLMSLALIFFEGFIFLATLAVWLFPRAIIGVIAPGFSEAQILRTIPLLKILFPFIFFISTSALIGGAFNAVNSFSVGAFAPVLLNICYIASLLFALTYKLSVESFASLILVAGCIHTLLHFIFYKKLGFTLRSITRESFGELQKILRRFGPALLGISVLELNIVIDTVFGSYLEPGTVTILHYGNRFMGIPLGIFGVALSTVLLPYFTRQKKQGAEKLSFYFTESAKFIIWVITPALLLMLFLAHDIFRTFIGDKIAFAQLTTATHVLQIYLLGLLIFCTNRIATSLFYALKNTSIPAYGTALSLGANVICNALAVYYESTILIPTSTLISSGILTLYYLYILGMKYKIFVNFSEVARLARELFLQLIIFSCLFIFTHKYIFMALKKLINPSLFGAINNGIGHWILVLIPVCFVGYFYYYFRYRYADQIYFLSPDTELADTK